MKLHIREDPEPGNRKCEALRDLHYLEYRQANLSWLSASLMNKTSGHVKSGIKTNLERNVITSNTNLEFLFPNNVFLRPITIVFSESLLEFRLGCREFEDLLRNLARFNYALEFLDH
jgi:hypothetical protein